MDTAFCPQQAPVLRCDFGAAWQKGAAPSMGSAPISPGPAVHSRPDTRRGARHTNPKSCQVRAGEVGTWCLGNSIGLQQEGLGLPLTAYLFSSRFYLDIYKHTRVYVRVCLPDTAAATWAEGVNGAQGKSSQQPLRTQQAVGNPSSSPCYLFAYSICYS